MTDLARKLADWATRLDPSDEDLALANRSLLDTMAVVYAAREDSRRPLFDQLGDAGRLAALAHVLDFDDLHLPSTTHISAICVPVALATGGGERAYLAGAGVMARLGAALGWRHYSAGWHATCTAGAPAAAVTAAVALGLDGERTARAMALAVPAAGGVQRAFGTAAKALQVGFAADAGVRAARLAQAGASADPRALDDWLALVLGEPEAIDRDYLQPAVPGGLAIKLFPCCYALQRPIAALVELPKTPADRIRRISVQTPASSLAPLIHSRPRTGLEGKFSLEYAVAATLLDGRPDLSTFTDPAVRRPQVRRLMGLVETSPTDEGDGLLTGEVKIELTLADGESVHTSLALPPGAPRLPPTDQQLRAKLGACAGTRSDELASLTWENVSSAARAPILHR